jgi:hypothetical protein
MNKLKETTIGQGIFLVHSSGCKYEYKNAYEILSRFSHWWLNEQCGHDFIYKVREPYVDHRIPYIQYRTVNRFRDYVLRDAYGNSLNYWDLIKEPYLSKSWKERKKETRKKEWWKRRSNRGTKKHERSRGKNTKQHFVGEYKSYCRDIDKNINDCEVIIKIRGKRRPWPEDFEDRHYRNSIKNKNWKKYRKEQYK